MTSMALRLSIGATRRSFKFLWHHPHQRHKRKKIARIPGLPRNIQEAKNQEPQGIGKRRWFFRSLVIGSSSRVRQTQRNQHTRRNLPRFAVISFR
jgi:hypothetical protein